VGLIDGFAGRTRAVTDAEMPPGDLLSTAALLLVEQERLPQRPVRLMRFLTPDLNSRSEVD
jgi:hypothetical protein